MLQQYYVYNQKIPSNLWTIQLPSYYHGVEVYQVFCQTDTHASTFIEKKFNQVLIKLSTPTTGTLAIILAGEENNDFKLT